MARPKSFSLDQLLQLALACFISGGYEGTSIDDLVQALQVHRGSLYKEFGSKRGLFLAVLADYVRSSLPAAIDAALHSDLDDVEDLTAGSALDLLLIAAIERGHCDAQVAALVEEALAQLESIPAPRSAESADGAVLSRAATILGTRLQRRLLQGNRPTDAQQIEQGTSSKAPLPERNCHGTDHHR